MRLAPSFTLVAAIWSFGLTLAQTPPECELGAWRTIAGSTPRRGHHAVWTGTEMIVWGGRNAQGQYINTGERYDPVADSLAGISSIGAPSPRAGGAVVWTGTHMLVWGGALRSGNGWVYYNDGALYDPATNTWTPISPVGAPSARREFAYAWSGTQLLVHGGYGEPSADPPPEGYENCEQTLLDALLYDPSTGTWSGFTTGPQVGEHGAIWTGDRFLVVGGQRQTLDYQLPGFCSEYLLPQYVAETYDPVTRQWADVREIGVPGDLNPVLLRGQGDVLVFGSGSQGDFPIRFDPSTSTWTSITPSGFNHQYVVWADGLVYLWKAPFESGAWDPSTDRWAPLSTYRAPPLRWEHTLVWTGEEMIVWGGRSSGGTTVFAGGAAYRPNDPDGDGLGGICDLCPNGEPGGFDSDDDGYGDACDNCPADANPTQQDLDADRLGDVCDPCALDPLDDDDGDGWCADEDNCPNASNLDQANDDGDAFGNACDHCPSTASAENLDSDADGRGDVCDNCPSVANAAQEDTDRELVRQWAVTATASSEWTDADWSANQATGPLELSICNSVLTNWAPLGGGTAAEWLEVGYSVPGPSIGVEIINSGVQSGFVRRVELIDTDGGAHTVWEGTDPSACGETLSLRWNQTAYDVSSVVVHTQVDEWEEIDAVELLSLGGPRTDLVGSACDVCPFVDDPAQVDSDSDGAGDLCDCAPDDPTARQPAEVGSLSVSTPAPGVVRIDWPSTAGADAFSVRRGLLSSLTEADYGACIATVDASIRQFDDTDLPPPSEGFLYLIQARDDVCGLGTLGAASNGRERLPVTPQDCP